MKMMLYWIRVGPNPITGVFTRRGEICTQTHRNLQTGECDMKTLAEIEVTHLRAKEHQGWPAAARLYDRDTKQTLPHRLQMDLPVP